MAKIQVPVRFEDTVALHISRHMIPLPDAMPPLLLGIHGPAGEGKTVQCEASFQELGLFVSRISGNELESENAGEPGRIIHERYTEASKALSKNPGRGAVLFINDIDLGIGFWGDRVTYTVNTQNASATLMHLADYRADRPTPPRVPIIITGNDFTTLYKPLVRTGRMESFAWSPSSSEKYEIVRTMFEGCSISQKEVELLVNTFADQPISFFAAIRVQLYDEWLLGWIREAPMSELVSRLVNEGSSGISCLVRRNSFQHILDIGHRIASAAKFQKPS